MGGVRNYGNLLESHRLFDALPEAPAGTRHVALMTVFMAPTLSEAAEVQLTAVLSCLHRLMSQGESFMFRTTYAQRGPGELHRNSGSLIPGSAETGIIICNYHSPAVETTLDGL